MRNKLTNKVTRAAGRFGLKVKKHSPEILAVVGVASVVTGTVLACKATTKASQILEETKAQLDGIHEVAEKKEITVINKETETEEVIVYTDEDKKKDLTITYVQTGIKLVKTYALPAGLVVFGLGALLASNDILRKRYMASAATCAALDKGFKEYRERVVERFGEDLDRELRYDIKAKEIEETIVDENGEEKTVKKTINVFDSEPSVYAKFFDNGCPYWTKDAERNKNYLIMQQNYANEKFRARGYMLLNDIYEIIGIPVTKMGNKAGWVWREELSDEQNRIDFKIFDGNRAANRDFVNGYEPTILLDFNCEPDITEDFWRVANGRFGSGECF